jgi:LuxR family quorum sensing-dependent transcriptional regulator
MATIPLRELHSVSVKQTYFDQETRTKIIDYSMEVESLTTPDGVLNRLHDIVSEKNPIRVHGANRFPTKVGDWRRIELGKNTFVHRDVPRGWTEEWTAFVRSGHCIGLMSARMCLAPLTWTEVSRLLDPVGIAGPWICYEGRRIDSRACLTPREQSVLRHASLGGSLKETAKALGLGEQTIRSHFKKAQAKLGTRNRTHTVAEAMRDLLII